MLVCIFSIHERWRSIKDIHKNTKKQKNNGQNKCQNKYAEDQQAKKILTLVKYTPPQNDDLWLTTNIAAPVLHRRLSEILGRAAKAKKMPSSSEGEPKAWAKIISLLKCTSWYIYLSESRRT